MNSTSEIVSKVDELDLRSDFPILEQSINQKPLIYLDSAATTQKPACVIHALKNYYEYDNANIHRGVHTLSVRATDAYERTRSLVRNFINAEKDHEIIFVRGATEGINLVAQSFARSQLTSGDEIIISAMEHHSNIVPWQVVCEQTGAHLRIIPVNDNGEIDFNAYAQLLNERTKLVAVTHVSNAIGTVNPVEQMIRLAHHHNVPVLIDGAQAVPHMRVDVQNLDCDFYVFSAHKMYGPTGVGVLYGKSKFLTAMPPYQSGGDMIAEVTFEKTTYNKLPHKFEAGTPNISGVVAFGAAIEYLNKIGMSNIYEHEQKLLKYATARLKEIKGLTIIGNAQHKSGAISFVLENIHPHDIGTVLDHHGIAIRAGHHCAMPLMTRFNVPATARISFGVYNVLSDIDAVIAAIEELKRLFG